MGCTGSKQKKKLDLSDSSYTSITSSKLNASPSPPPSKQVKPKQTKVTKPARKTTATKKTVPATAINNIQNGEDKIDGNKMTIQRSLTPTPMQSQQQQTANRVKSTQSTSMTARKTGWTDEQLLSQLQYLDFDTSSNIVRLFDEGNTIPFMCRYRRELIGNLDADK